MLPNQFTVAQNKVLTAPLDGSLFIEGMAMTGKTTACLSRLDLLLNQFAGHQILIMAPQQSLAKPYRDHLFSKNNPLGGIPRVTTISGLARDLVSIFWPEIKTVFDFTGGASEPFFLSLETAQFCMARIVDPLLEKGYFQAVKIERHRLYSQIIDNLNKAAIHGLSPADIAKRLISTSSDPGMLGVAYHQVAECAASFRSFCLQNNLIDFSLLMEIARQYLFSKDLPRSYLNARYQVLIADNIEEDTPLTHDFYRHSIQTFSSATLVFDHHAGFRTFLGADSDHAYELKTVCDFSLTLDEPLNRTPSVNEFRTSLLACIDPQVFPSSMSEIPQDIHLSVYQFLPEMIDNVVVEIDRLIQSGIPADDIAVLTPYLSDVLKYSITEKLSKKGINLRTFRPSRKYLASSAIKALFILARLAHPDWHLPLSHFEFRDCLMRLVKDLDVIRADYAAKALLGKNDRGQFFRSFDELTNLGLQETITFSFGHHLSGLAEWLADYTSGPVAPLDVFLQRLFGEILSQPGYTLHADLDAANDIARAIQSVRAFRAFSSSVFNFDEPALGKAYIESIHAGLLPASFDMGHQEQEGVLIAPAHSFLMQNRSVAYQFWLDIGSLGWWERLYQPLTNPYVYQSSWEENSSWNENREFAVNQAMMAKLINGLLLRCGQAVYASIVQTNEFGAQNSGPLLRAFQKLVKKGRRLNMEEDHV